MRDWAQWHADYDRPGSPLARRLLVVQERLRDALHALGPDPVVLLSLCSGDGRDVLGVLAECPRLVQRVVLVEKDRGLAERANTAAREMGLSEVEVRCRDAGEVASFLDVIPVDVLLLCGIFGNIEHGTVRSVIDLVPGFVNTGGYVIWTRGGSQPDRRSEIRNWFVQAGLEEVAFDGEPEPFGVGFNRVTASARAKRAVPGRLFTFTR